MKKKLPPVYRFEWIDANNSCGWTEYEDVYKESRASKCVTVGYLLEEKKDSYMVTSTLCLDDGGILGYTNIPKAWVKKKKRLC